MTQSFWHLHLGLSAFFMTLILSVLMCFFDLPESIKLLAILLAPVGPILISVWEGK